MTESTVRTTIPYPVQKVLDAHSHLDPQPYPYSHHQPLQGGLVEDCLAIEEPLEIRIEYDDSLSPLNKTATKTVAMTMRTPGDDRPLAIGFLFSEGMISSPKDLTEVSLCGPSSPVHGGQNIVRVKLAAGVKVPLQDLERLFMTNSSCGICGKTSFESLALIPQNTGKNAEKIETRKVHPNILFSLPAKLLNAQRAFARTGGLHAAALVTFEGVIESLFEDVGRHNAVDKIVGAQFLAGTIPLKNKIVLVSGRASFELVQKSIKAGASMLVALGAPSSLALDLAAKYDLTLIGFARDQKFNIYTGGHRVGS